MPPGARLLDAFENGPANRIWHRLAALARWGAICARRVAGAEVLAHAILAESACANLATAAAVIWVVALGVLTRTVAALLTGRAAGAVAALLAASAAGGAAAALVGRAAYTTVAATLVARAAGGSAATLAVSTADTTASCYP